MDNKNKNPNTEERQLDELEKFLLTHRSKLQKEEQKSIDEDFDASFSMEKNFLAIQAKIKNEQANRLEPKNILEEKAKKLLQIEEEKEEKPKNWVKPSPISSETTKTVRLGQTDIKRDVNNWVKPAPINSPYSATSLETRNQETTPTPKTVSIRKFWTVAASLTALLVTTFVYHVDTISVLTHENEELISRYEENGLKGFDEEFEGNKNQNYSQNVSLPAELIEAENYYTSMIAKEKKELKKKDTENWVTPETIQTLDELDEAYKVMKSDLLQEQNPKKLVDEMLNNLKLRKEILDESIQILENSKSSDSETNKNI
ncbi:hypothetical protein Fleli_1693 [Bernardetia litoralis DSM 6794]|uniref:Anti-sigma factor n=1 Tax=Bernardetia litoralis (strain ATCC 23117 / DSM 6794 / NBRC 15988 / NCIMB 1366 / Fx l1 / Sio-4) TaxID=880071 RepID=I4AJG6_BERLS|nr:hypothetical protein [Bernardetia litoralis]AFM04101.1 hypothetical protein Fleli_1693 [Bernardetia litoralis DSM 6794]